MLSTLLAIGWEPEIRGAIVVMIGVVVLMGSVYLILGSNVGARLGLLISLAGLGLTGYALAAVATAAVTSAALLALADATSAAGTINTLPRLSWGEAPDFPALEAADPV